MPEESNDARADDQNDSPAPYKFCIMRHGVAVMRGTAGFSDDSKRPLTAQGKKKMQGIARGLRRLGFNPDWIVTSPLVRAVETAELVAESVQAKLPLDCCDALRPGGSPESLIAFLAKHADRKRVLVVGHEPDLSQMAARLIGSSRHANLAFKKGGCCLISFTEFPPKSPGELVWWLTPRILRKLA
jgi:phosphohistidine phosphatase